jgi:hypothetical protein
MERNRSHGHRKTIYLPFELWKHIEDYLFPSTYALRILESLLVENKNVVMELAHKYHCFESSVMVTCCSMFQWKKKVWDNEGKRFASIFERMGLDPHDSYICLPRSKAIGKGGCQVYVRNGTILFFKSI